MDRRAFLKGLGILYGSTSFAAGITDTAHTAISPLTRFKLGAISDGFSQDFEEALKAMKSYGLSWVEIREVFGVYNTEANPAQIQRLKDLLDRYQFRVSVIDSALYKCALPGTRPVKGEKDKFAYPEQMELLKRALDRAHTLGADKIRGFTFWRVAEPGKLSGRIAEELRKAAELANRSGMRLVIENEESCNAATGRELAEILTMAPAHNLGANWDVGNGYWRGEVSFPDGYNGLDKKRIWHMHLKGVACGSNYKNCSETFVGQGQVDLVGQFSQLLRDGYQETMSLECEFKAPGLTHFETTKRSLKGLLRVMADALV
ncbi:MAG: sugar phosphate isomerase/epimerase family protein [Bryobacteraceae bacterium]